MSGNKPDLEKRLEAAVKHIQVLEQLLHRAGMVVKGHGLAAERILTNCNNLPKSAKESLMLMVEDAKKGVIVGEDDPELQMNWGKDDEYVGAGSGAANGAGQWLPELKRSDATYQVKEEE